MSVNGQRYVPNWVAIAAVASGLAVAAAAVAIFYSVRLVRDQMGHSQAQEMERAERERLLELKRFEQGYLARIFDVADRTYHELHELSSRILAHAAGRQSGLSVETASAAAEAGRDYAATTAAILHILKASRAQRFPNGAKDEVFDRYEKVTNTVVKQNLDLLKAVLANPAATPTLMAGADAEATLYLNQLLKSCTGRLIALMFGRESEWDSPDFVNFVDRLIAKEPAAPA